MTPPFERTSCSCDADVENCRKMPGYLGPGDVERIAAHLGLSVEGLLASGQIEEGKGAVVTSINVGEFSVRKIRTLRPTLRPTGCTFLTANGLCGIHAVSPFGCAYFDVHMSHGDANQRSAWGLRLVDRDPVYAAQVESVSKFVTLGKTARSIT